MSLWQRILSWFGGKPSPPKWDKCTRASCWNGANAEQRMMNILSPGMGDSKFRAYLEWMKSRGCNTAHVFIANQADGEHGGYCIYGNAWDWTIDEHFCKLFRDRIAEIRKAGMAVCIWLFADDSRWNKEAAKDFPRYLRDVKAQKLLDQASIVVVGLELQDYFNSAKVVQALVSATRDVFKGKVGTHEIPGRLDFAALADVPFYQVKPGLSVSKIKSEAVRVSKAVGRPWVFHEIERQPSREKCEAALAGGAFSVGNW